MNYILLASLLAAFVLVPNRVGTSFAQEERADADVADKPPEELPAELPAELRAARDQMTKLARDGGSGPPPPPSDMNQDLLDEFQFFKTWFEEIDSCGFYPQEARLACVVRIKRTFRYANHPIGTMEHIKFCIDWNNSNTWEPWESVGESHVNVHNNNNAGFPPSGLNYLIYRDINPWNPTGGGPRTLDSVALSPPIFRARAVLSFVFPPTDCNSSGGFFGDVHDFNIQLDPAR